MYATETFMLNHITLCVKDLERSKRFYAAALKPLEYELLTSGGTFGFGKKECDGWGEIWLNETSERSNPSSFTCLAFTAASKQEVDEFYQAALAAGGIDNGPPGYRTQYSAGYYAAFVLDLDGYNIEAVYNDEERKR